ncbi:MAG: 4-hydroxybenzoyl-CoA reductase subunit gamma [Elusimicrobia bacterium ADurb.Bin231]|nr:MAG: 4-hydroxybenzoyl-CoA reductase subunit gamma [Elusimicrobia bacterium ADurb.Bin231]
MLSFIINNKEICTDLPSGMVLLDFIREEQHLTGTKEACREGECGACTVLVGTMCPDGISYKACASCILPIGDVKGCHIVTVEGLSGDTLNTVQRLIVENNASQCGFCTPGIVLSLTGFCLTSETFAYEDAIDALDGNICRCTGYVSIRSAARCLCEELRHICDNKNGRIPALIEAGVLPRYFLDIPARLKALASCSVSADTSSKCSNSNTVPVAGGTDLFVQKPEELRAAHIAFLSRRSDLNYIRAGDASLFIGSAVTIEEFRNSPEVLRYFPSMKSDLLRHSSHILRNKATLAGNIINASPVGDMSIILLALGARLVIEGKDGKTRNTPLEEFFLGYKKMAYSCGELVREIVIPLPSNTLFNFEKVSNRETLDIAAVNTAMHINISADDKIVDLRISAGGVAPIPLLVRGLEKFYGLKTVPDTCLAIADTVMNSVTPIDDIRGSAEYKKLLLKQLILAHFDTFGIRQVTK